MDITEIERMVKEYCERPYVTKLFNLEEMEKSLEA